MDLGGKREAGLLVRDVRSVVVFGWVGKDGEG